MIIRRVAFSMKFHEEFTTKHMELTRAAQAYGIFTMEPLCIWISTMDIWISTKQVGHILAM
jgi:hypothetical protein